MILDTTHKQATKVKIGIKMHKNKNAEKYNYQYALNLFAQAIEYTKENNCFVLVQVAQALNVPRKRFSYLANKYQDLKPLYLFLVQCLEVETYKQTKNRQMPFQLAKFLLRFVYGWKW